MSEELLVQSYNKDTKAYRVIEDVLKGKEISLPEEYAWKDKDGHLRTKNRSKWWMDIVECTYGECLFNCPSEMKEVKPEAPMKITSYPKDAPPVFFGHYWLSDAVPSLQSANVACLDYSIAKGGNLIAYRLKGEKVLVQKHFIGVTGL